ncbi:MAG: GGDEF domain-containing protein [Thalassolituus sp.]|uniref:GGDEF domain-containing protein n=1 Tax=Thalassolituus sp. TaxID=2030822 RepID=UPI0039827E82
MHKGSIGQDSATLGPIEGQINTLLALLQRGRFFVLFPRELEDAYAKYSLTQTLTSDLRIVYAGLMIFLLFGWADLHFGGDNGIYLLTIRACITVALAAVVFFTFKTTMKAYRLYLVGLGTYICFASLLWNVTYVPVDMSYFYHMGMIPMQVFTMMALRVNFRIMFVASVAMLITYAIFMANVPLPIDPTPVDVLAHAIAPYYIFFWMILIAMGAYLSFEIEASARTDYIKNRLLALEAERLKYLGLRLHQLSTTDSLTGISNRRFIEEKMFEEWNRCMRSALPVAIIMIDVDAFKRYNDFYGHQQGDICLRTVAAKINEYCKRPGDECARYGGEEFVILLPETKSEEACRMAEEIRRGVEALGLKHEKSNHEVATVSIGVAAEVPAMGSSYEALLRRADEHLYEAKGSGRNRVSCAA